MSSPVAGKYNKTNLMTIFGIGQNSLDKMLIASGSRLPVGNNILDSRKTYTDETIEFLKNEFRLEIVVDPSKI